MLNSIKIPIMFLTLTLLILLPKAADAREDQHGRSQGVSHHEHGYHAYANPELTLVSGMEGVDYRVLIASDPDQTPDDTEQAVTVVGASTPVQVIGSDMDVFIVNVPNYAGGYTPVLIKKWGNGFLGPQGELYFPFPEVSQLKAMYGM